MWDKLVAGLGNGGASALNGGFGTQLSKGFSNGGTSLWGSLKNGFNSFNDFLGSDAGKNSLDFLGTAGGLWQGFQQGKQAKKALKMQEDAYNFNKFLANEARAKTKANEDKLAKAWS